MRKAAEAAFSSATTSFSYLRPPQTISALSWHLSWKKVRISNPSHVQEDRNCIAAPPQHTLSFPIPI